MNVSLTIMRVVTIALMVGAQTSAQTPSQRFTLAGTSWQLVEFRGGDGTTLRPDDRSKYTIAFAADGTVAARIDCNRGRSTWKSTTAGQLELGPLALTRAMCPPGSLHDRIVKHWEYVRSYVLKDGRLFLALMADGGIYEFEPAPGPKPAQGASPIASKGPVAFDCTKATGGTDRLVATFCETEPAMVLVELADTMRPAFRVRAGSAADRLLRRPSTAPSAT